MRITHKALLAFGSLAIATACGVKKDQQDTAETVEQTEAPVLSSDQDDQLKAEYESLPQDIIVKVPIDAESGDEDLDSAQMFGGLASTIESAEDADQFVSNAEQVTTGDDELDEGSAPQFYAMQPANYRANAQAHATRNGQNGSNFTFHGPINNSNIAINGHGNGRRAGYGMGRGVGYPRAYAGHRGTFFNRGWAPRAFSRFYAGFGMARGAYWGYRPFRNCFFRGGGFNYYHYRIGCFRNRCF